MRRGWGFEEKRGRGVWGGGGGIQSRKAYRLSSHDKYPNGPVKCVCILLGIYIE